MDNPEHRFREIYQANAERVFAYALRRTSRQEATEVVADTFLIAWKRVNQLPDDPLPWLLGVARKVVANRRRGQRRRSALESKLERATSTASRPTDDPAELAEARSTISHALDGLRPWDQEALRLIAWDGLDHKQAARAMGCSPSTFAVRLHRARRRFEAQLAGTHNESTPRLAKEIR